MAAIPAPKEDQNVENHDPFFWIGEINKASAVINVAENLLDRTTGQRIARGLKAVLDAGNRPAGPRPGRVITFEPLLIKAAGIEATLLHAGRSSQDMLSTASTAMLRERTLRLAAQLHLTTSCMVHIAAQHVDTLVPNYTNGVAAQPNSYGHYLLGHVAGLARDTDRLVEFYARLDRSAMGTTVLNGTGWPLNRERMAAYLGFARTADNAYDAVQISGPEMTVELGSLCTSIALHAGAFIQDIMTQYAQPRPWILLQEGGDNTYMSSAMPQKRNPGLLNNTRARASRVVTLGVGRAIQTHNVPPGMQDAKITGDDKAVVDEAMGLLADWQRVLNALRIDKSRALEELNRDWTASQEVADVLMRRHRVPFRVGHHFASEMVSFARTHNIRPSDFPYDEAVRIYAETVGHMKLDLAGFPMSEEEFREALDPAAIVRDRATGGGPQPVEMRRMVAVAEAALVRFESWTRERTEFIESSLTRLNRDFDSLLQA